MQLSRRSFLKGAASVGIVGAAAGLAGCAPSSSGGDAKAGGDAGAAPAASQRVPGYICDENWLGEAPAIADGDIAETKTFDVVVVGGGHAGTQAALAAAQQGATVAVIEKHKDGEIVYRGETTFARTIPSCSKAGDLARMIWKRSSTNTSAVRPDDAIPPSFARLCTTRAR